jgi:hypothetical protein
MLSGHPIIKQSQDNYPSGIVRSTIAVTADQGYGRLKDTANIVVREHLLGNKLVEKGR